MRRLLISLGCTAVLIAPLTPLPHAAATGKCITDPRGDTKNAPQPKANYDIVGACGHRASHHRIITTVKLAGAVDNPQSPQAYVPTLVIDVPGQKFDNPTCDYFVQGAPPGVGANHTNHTKYYVNTCQNSGSQQVGPALVTRISKHVMKVVIHRRAIGNPKRFGFAFSTFSDGDQPSYDRAPDKGFQHIRLR